MSSLTQSHVPARTASCKRTLQRLRREAGYRSAKDFAEALDIPSSTYARYERAGDGADCGIPLPAAWQIADALGCSIDLVVGRADVDAPDPDGIQTRYDALSTGGRALVECYLNFVEQTDADALRFQGRR